MKDINLLILLVLIGLVVYFIYKNQENLKSKESKEESKEEPKNESNTSNKVLGVYYTDWCGYSRDFLTQLNDGLKNKLENENVSVKLVDCEKNKETCQKLGIEGFPTLLLHKDEEIVYYNGNRTEDDLLNFVKSN
jgi:thiol-disulfide isomerase/thioredoxin